MEGFALLRLEAATADGGLAAPLEAVLAVPVEFDLVVLLTGRRFLEAGRLVVWMLADSVKAMAMTTIRKRKKTTLLLLTIVKGAAAP